MKKQSVVRLIIDMNVMIDTNAYISDLKQLIEEGQEVVITVTGWSMQPFLRNRRDRVSLIKPSDICNIGDIVLYRRKTGQFVLHRIYNIKSDGYYMMGDNQVDMEGPIEADTIFAVVTEIERNGRWISVKGLPWIIASCLWRVLYPVRKIAYRTRKAMRK